MQVNQLEVIQKDSIQNYEVKIQHVFTSLNANAELKILAS